MTTAVPTIWDRRFPVVTVKNWVAGILAGIYSPEPDEEIWEWAERTLRIPSTENEEMAGMLWSSSLTPYVRELMKWVRRPGKGEFWIKKSSQVGFTMAVLIIICWMIVHRPGNVAYAIDSLDEARKISKIRLRRWIENNRLLENIGENPDDLANLTYYLKGMTVHMMGAHSKGAWANKSITLCILDELDKHPYIEGEGTTVTLARERLKRPKNAKLIGFSTPGEGDKISIEWEKGTREEIRIPFPCCGHYQALHWKNFIFSGKEFQDLAGRPDREKIERDAYFKCELCAKGRLLDKHKSRALQQYQAAATHDKATGRVRSLHIWDAYSPFVTFGELALEWIDAQGDDTLLERYFRGRRGEKWEKQGKTLGLKDLLKCKNAALHRGKLHFRPVLVMQAIDVQETVKKYVKIAVDPAGNLHIIDWGTTLDLNEAASRAYEPIPGPDGETYQVTAGFIDEGHQMLEVRRTCLAHLPIFWPVKGRGVGQIDVLIGTSIQYIDGEEIMLYGIAEDQFKWQMLKMLSDPEKREKRGDPRIFFPVDVDDDDEFLEEFTTERPMKEKNKLGREKWVWKKKKEDKNDYWDCTKYALALWTVMRPILVPEGITR